MPSGLLRRGRRACAAFVGVLAVTTPACRGADRCEVGRPAAGVRQRFGCRQLLDDTGSVTRQSIELVGRLRYTTGYGHLAILDVFDDDGTSGCVSVDLHDVPVSWSCMSQLSGKWIRVTGTYQRGASDIAFGLLFRITELSEL